MDFRYRNVIILLLKVPIPEPDQFAFLFLNLTLTLNFSFYFFACLSLYLSLYLNIRNKKLCSNIFETLKVFVMDFQNQVKVPYFSFYFIFDNVAKSASSCEKYNSKLLMYASQFYSLMTKNGITYPMVLSLY